MARHDKRFQKIHSEGIGFGGRIEILRDSRTGVCYLWRNDGTGGGLTPLLDAQGRPLQEHGL